MNVVSNEKIAAFISRLAVRAQRPEVAEWLKRVLPKRVRSLDAACSRIFSEGMFLNELGKMPSAPRKRLLAAFRAGEHFHYFNHNAPAAEDLSDEVDSVVDWLDAIPEWDRHLRRIDRMSYSDAATIARDWHAKLLTLAANADDPDVAEELVELQVLPDGQRFVDLVGPVSLLREGRLMGHCVGGRGYVLAVRSGSTRIISLRDADNKPHATLEVRRNHVAQIKGKGNEVPVERWAALVRPFVMAQNWSVGRDGNRIDLFTIGQRTVHGVEGVVEAAFAPDTAVTNVDAVLPPSARALLRESANSLSQKARLLILDALDRGVTAPRQVIEAVLIEDAAEKRLCRVRHELPMGIATALEDGLFRGVEDRAAEILGRQLDHLFDGIAREARHVHVIRLPRNGDAGMLYRLAAFSGRLDRYSRLVQSVGEARARAKAVLETEVRRHTAVTNRHREEGDWALKAAQLRRIKPESEPSLPGCAVI